MVCGSIAGGLLGPLATDALRPGIATLVERIVLVTARVNDGGAEIVQAVLDSCISIAEECGKPAPASAETGSFPFPVLGIGQSTEV